MRKNALTLALAGALFATPAAFAGGFNYQLYGNLNAAMDLVDDDQADLSSNTSAFGVKGSQKLSEDSNTKAIFKFEFQIDVTERNTNIVDRDQWIGMKGDFGKVLVGTMTMNYKQTHNTDNMWRTNLEARGFLNTISNLHKGDANDRGRMTNTIQYSSNKIAGGLMFIGNVSFDGDQDDAYGLGVRYKTDDLLLYLDTFHDGALEEDAWKVGGTFNMGSLKVGAQYESAEEVSGYDYIHASATYKMDKKNSVKFHIGKADSNTAENTSWALMFDHKFNKQINMYAGYGSRDNNNASDQDMISVGARYKF